VADSKPVQYKSLKKGKFSLFINQIPFDGTAEDVQAHFASCGSRQQVRLVKSKDAGFKGSAFVDLESEGALLAGLKLNLTTLRTATGSQRLVNVRRAVQNIDASQIDVARAASAGDARKIMMQAVAAELASKSTGLLKSDINEQAMSFLVKVPLDVAQLALRDFGALDLRKVKCRSSFFMGILKQRLAGKKQNDFSTGPSAARRKVANDGTNAWQRKQQHEEKMAQQKAQGGDDEGKPVRKPGRRGKGKN
jgi:RNA recognition motif-containing protein